MWCLTNRNNGAGIKQCTLRGDGGFRGFEIVALGKFYARLEQSHRNFLLAIIHINQKMSKAAHFCLIFF